MADLKVSSEDLAFFIALAEDLAFTAGYRAGVAAADRAMRNHIAEATAGMPHSAAGVVRQLLKVWDRPEVTE